MLNSLIPYIPGTCTYSCARHAHGLSICCLWSNSELARCHQVRACSVALLMLLESSFGLSPTKQKVGHQLAAWSPILIGARCGREAKKTTFLRLWCFCLWARPQIPLLYVHGTKRGTGSVNDDDRGRTWLQDRWAAAGRMWMRGNSCIHKARHLLDLL